MRNIGIISQYEDNPKKARDLFVQALQRTDDEQMKAYLYICLAQAYQGLNSLDSATFCIERAMELCKEMITPPVASIFETLIQIETSKGNYRDALQYAQKQIEYEQNIFEKNLAKQLSEAERKYNYEAEKNKNQQLTIHRKNDYIVFLCITAGCLFVALAFFAVSLRRKKTIIKNNRTIDTLTRQAEKQGNQVTFLNKEIERNREIAQQLENEKNARIKEINEAIDAKIKSQEELVGHLKNQLRTSYSNILKYQIQTHKNYEGSKKNLDMEKNWKIIQTFNMLLYGNSGNFNWETVSQWIPVNIEKRIKENYHSLNVKEIRLCCLTVFGVGKEDILLILNMSKNSFDTGLYRIRQKTGMKDIQKELTQLIL